MLSLLWWILVIAATVQAGRAWGPLLAVGVFGGLWFLAWGTVLTVLTGAAAIGIGLQAENEMTKRLTG